MGGGSAIRMKRCKECNRPLDRRRWRRPKRFCRRRHQVRYWLETVGDILFG